MKCFVCSLAAALAACGGTGPDGHMVGPDAAPMCTPSQSTTTIMVPSATNVWTPLAAAGPQAMIARQNDGTGAIQVAYVTDAPVSLATLADAAQYKFAAAAVPGSQCAVVSSSKTGLALACPGVAPDVASSVQDISGDPVFPVQTASSLFVYTQTFASFTEIEHASTGGWHEHEQYESSVSFPTDAALAGGEPIACFINSGGYAAVARGDARAAIATPAHWCKIAVAGDTIHVLTDAGYGTVSLASLQTPNGTINVTPVAALPVAPLQLVMIDAAPHALVYTSDGVQLVPLPSGPPIALTGPTGGSAQVRWDASLRAVIEISTKLDASGPGPTYPETVYFETRCVP